MKRIVATLILGMCHRLLFAQVVMNLQLPPAGVISKDQLWNISLINSGEYQLSVRLEMQFTDVSNNQRVFTAVTRELIIPKGVKQIRQADILPVTYNIVNPTYNVDANSSGFLPVGVFNACYSVVSTGGHTQEYISDECETIEIEPVSPPALIVPADVERVEMTRPLFTWTPPAPISLFNKLNYDFALVEVFSSQSPSDAIQQNIPVCFISNINATNLQYPATLAELDTGKVYAWRVKAKSGSQAVANSEIWTFTIDRTQQTQKTSIAYADFSKTERSQRASYITCNKEIDYQYDNTINDSIVVTRIYDISGANRKIVYQQYELVNPGVNYKHIDLKRSVFVAQHMYMLEINNSKREKFYLKFLCQ